jgi:ribbon-helix-helix protein, copG family|nr:MAG TPA: Ribbon-helix-helix domain [Caudoviricetes sp.]
MENRGAKKGRKITWDVGRKKADPGMESKKISVALPAKMWAELTEKAEKQGMTRNKLIRNILEIYLKK